MHRETHAALIIIPARLGSSRIAQKPLQLINGRPLIAHIHDSACAAQLAPVVVACDDARIADIIQERGGRAVLTGSAHASGSDRVFEALQKIDAEGRAQIIVNLQGDIPVIDRETIAHAITACRASGADIGTVATRLDESCDAQTADVTKVVGRQLAPRHFRALYFSRAAVPAGPGPRFRHLGIYAFRRAALARFAQLPPSALEKRERLEQLRALEAGMQIDFHLVGHAPPDIDTARDLEETQARFAELAATYRPAPPK